MSPASPRTTSSDRRRVGRGADSGGGDIVEYRRLLRAHTLAASDLHIAALWPLHFLANDLPHLSLLLRVRDAARVTSGLDEEARPSAGGARVGIVWRARATFEAANGPGMTQERWHALLRATQDRNGKPRSLTIRLQPSERISLACLPVAGARGTSITAPKEDLVAPRRWALLTVASGVYRDLPPSMAQDWNCESARLIRHSLSDWSPTVVRTLDAKLGAGLTRGGVLAFVSDGLRQAKRARAEFIVVYYVGHIERKGTGNLLLLIWDVPKQRPNPPRAPRRALEI